MGCFGQAVCPASAGRQFLNVPGHPKPPVGNPDRFDPVVEVVGLDVEHGRAVKGIKAAHRQHVLAPAQQFDHGQSDGIGSVGCAGREKAHRGQIRPAPGMDFEGNGRGRFDPVHPEDYEQVRIAFDALQGLRQPGIYNHVGYHIPPPEANLLVRNCCLHVTDGPKGDKRVCHRFKDSSLLVLWPAATCFQSRKGPAGRRPVFGYPVQKASRLKPPVAT